MNKQDTNRQDQHNQPQGQGSSGKTGNEDGARYGKEPQDKMHAAGKESQGQGQEQWRKAGSPQERPQGDNKGYDQRDQNTRQGSNQPQQKNGNR
jgi:hypothetical protein